MLTWEEAAIADNYNKSLARWSQAYYELEARFEQVCEQRNAAQKNVDKLVSRLAQTNAHAQGLSCQVTVLQAELAKLSPNNTLLQNNPKGQKWRGGKFAGKVVSNIGLEYTRGFEKTLIEMGADAKDLPDWYI